MDITSLLTGGLVDSIVTILKGVGILKDPEQEHKARELIAKQAEASNTFFLEYFKATIGENEPWYAPNRLFRPLCSFFVVGFYCYCRLNGVALEPTDQILIGGIVGFWFGGRTIEKLFGKV